MLLRNRSGKELVSIMSNEPIMKTAAFTHVIGTSKEMLLRMLLHSIRQAADNGDSGISIPMYKINKLHVPTLDHEILELAGFKTIEFKDKDGVKKLRISWN